MKLTFLIFIFHLGAGVVIFTSSFSILIDFELMISCFLKFSFIILLDKFRLIFFLSVILISFRVFFFRQSYIKKDKYFLRFHILLSSFVLSIIILIFSPNLISILLGWDGLGIRSYLLVIYYSRKKSFNSGIVTILSNRVGDALILVSVCYLIIRFSDTLYLLGINYILLILGPLTILIARGSAFYEIDIKKIVALSTLRQLGVIITAMGAGIYLLRFFHLLTHAFFKALLFIGAGNLIHSSERYQDLRVMGGGSEVIPYSKSIVIATSISLCGLPFMSAFYSKEIIIERLLIINSFL